MTSSTSLPPLDQTPDLEDRVLAKIEAEHVSPRPRWIYRIRDASLFFAWMVFILAGAFTVSAFLFVWANAGWELSQVTHADWRSFFAEEVPVLWLVSFSGLLLAALWSARTWRHGYRYSLLAIAAGGFLVSVLFGCVLFFLGAGQAMDEFGGRTVPGYLSAVKRQEARWSRPERGLLAGDVLTVSSSEPVVRIRELSGGEWLVLMPEGSVVFAQERVRFVGHVKDQAARLFEACATFPWEIRGGSWRPNEPIFRPHPEVFPWRERKSADRRITRCRDVRPTPFHLTP